MRLLDMMKFDAPTDVDGSGSPAPVVPPVTPVPAPAAAPTGMITQEKMNSLLSVQKQETRAKVKTLTDQLKTQADAAETSEADKVALNLRIDELNTTVMTAEELSTENQRVLTEKLNTTQAELTSDRDGWKKKFFDAEVGREIITFATEAGAVNNAQISDLILHKVKAELDKDGKHSFMIGEGEEAKSIKDHILAMKENVEQYGNLFRTDKVSGQGTSNANTQNMSDVANMSIDQIIADREKKFGPKTH